MVCENCGNENAGNAVFCAFCGKKLAASPRRAVRREKVAVSGSGRKQVIPDRPAPVAGRDASTLIPRRKRRDDMFFDDAVLPDEDPYDEDRMRDRRARRRSLIAGIVLLGVMIYVFWLLVLPGGQEYRASIGWGAPAGAYSRLGDNYLADGDVQSAARYYYDALRLDPDNYEYARDVASTQALLANYETALAAYAKCITLDENAAENYKAVSDIYVAMGDNERAMNALMTGFNRTGDLTLFRAYQQITSN
ncbi:MAG: hypothetical protein Q4D04_02060 [Clostridia bacterium]|nr:hypothetical protein [Clostridia bacterium]